MAQYIKQGDIWGRVGSGIGQGLAQQLPEEIQRGRLAQGLQQLSQQKGLSPFQQFASLSSLPGITPQMIQSGSELLRQQGMLEGAKNLPEQDKTIFNQIKQDKIDEERSKQELGLKKEPSGFIDPLGTKAALESYIPKSLRELQQRALELHSTNPKIYPTWNDAYQGAVQEDQQNQVINQAQQQRRSTQSGVEEKIKGKLSELRAKANVEIPENVYQDVENDVLEQIRSGVPESVAEKKGLEKMDQISRDYKNLDALGGFTYIFQNPKEARRAISSLRNDFEKRKDLENFADLLAAKGISNDYAYHEAFPIERNKELSTFVKSLPKIDPALRYKNNPVVETTKILNKLSDMMTKNDSPLSIATELDRLGYDSNTFLNYLSKNKRKLDLSERQARELDKTRSTIPSLQDIWFLIGQGKEKLLEE